MLSPSLPNAQPAAQSASRPPLSKPVRRHRAPRIELLDFKVHKIATTMAKPDPLTYASTKMRPLPHLIFASRWLQLPLYLGLIVAQVVYVVQFWIELVHLVEAALGSATALEAIRESVAVPGAEKTIVQSRETLTMLLVLGLIDVVMISNLLIMVIVGGYETFVSRMRLESHPDQPEWLSHVNASVLKVKLATAIIGISSIHLLRTFINAAAYDEKTLLWQTVIHVTFLLSALSIAAVDRLMPQGGARNTAH
jgi:uncharacterized protein (TIGR00645 family)